MRRQSRATLAALCRAALLVLVCAAVHAQEYGAVIYEKDSLYHRIMVHQSGSLMTLRFGSMNRNVVQSQVDLGNRLRHVNEYTELAYAGFLHKRDPASVLVVGLGGGVIPMDLRHYFPRLRIDVVELDPDVQPVAERFFGFKTDELMQVHVADGRMFIKRLLRQDPVPRYDMIILDAFLGDYIPFHLMTREFLEEVRGVLTDDGVVVANVFYTNQLCHAELKTFLAVFGRCQVYQGIRSGNAMLVAPGPKGPVLTSDEAVARAAALQEEHGFAFDIRNVALHLMPGAQPDPSARVLTDDQAPVDWLRHQEAEPPTAEGKP